ncbi:MAG: hypothetical protein PHP44_14090 [Kiritimatiellae bacterium]|nr:hypothetical protein [Kiritimatiellia bacterium]
MSWLILAAGVFLLMSQLAAGLVLWPVFLLSTLLGLLLVVCRDGVHGTLVSLCSILVYSLLLQLMPQVLEELKTPPVSAAVEAAAESTGLPDDRSNPLQQDVPAPANASRQATRVAQESTPFVEGGAVPVDEETAMEFTQPTPPAPGFQMQAEWPFNASGQMVPDMPFLLYDDCYSKMPFAPFGMLGNEQALLIDDCWKENVHRGKTCMRIVYDASGAWAGGAWQAPPNNWGNRPALYDLSKAAKLTFWARSESGEAMAEFRVGLSGSRKGRYRDSAVVSTGRIRLSTEWTQYSIDVSMANLTHIINGFSWTVYSTGKKVEIFLDDVQFESSGG